MEKGKMERGKWKQEKKIVKWKQEMENGKGKQKN